MQGLLLDRTSSIWRKVAGGPGYSDTQIYSGIRCAIVPISNFDTDLPFARESTHIVWVDYWLMLRKGDQIRDGRQLPDAQGDLVPWVYTVNGRRDFRLGIPQIAYYAREQD